MRSSGLQIRRLDESEEVLHRWSHKGHSKEVQIHVERDEERKMTRLFSSLDNIVKVVDVPDNGTGESSFPSRSAHLCSALGSRR